MTTTKRRMTKAAIVNRLATDNDISKKDVSQLLESLKTLIKEELSDHGPGEFVLPDMIKLKVRKVEAQQGKKFRNPATGETIIKDVPASKKLRATPLKKLKDMVL
jgi:nucleoid DNA-binding protein